MGPRVMADVELLPLPEHFAHQSERVQEHVHAYASANLAPLQAENERLRAEVERLTGCLATANANHEQFERQWYLERDRAERLAEALRGMLDVAAESFANRTYVPINCQQAANAYAALAQEDRNG